MGRHPEIPRARTASAEPPSIDGPHGVGLRDRADTPFDSIETHQGLFLPLRTESLTVSPCPSGPLEPVGDGPLMLWLASVSASTGRCHRRRRWRRGCFDQITTTPEPLPSSGQTAREAPPSPSLAGLAQGLPPEVGEQEAPELPRVG